MKLFKKKDILVKNSVIKKNKLLSFRGPRPKTILRKKKRDVKSIFRMLFFFSFFLYIFFIFYVFFFSGQFVIRDITVKTQEETTRIEVLKILQTLFDHRIYGIVPGNTFFVTDTDKIEKIFSEHFSPLQFVYVEKKFPHTLSIHIEKRNSLVVWCPLSQDFEEFKIKNKENTSEQEIKNEELSKENDKNKEKEMVCDEDEEPCEENKEDKKSDVDEFDSIGDLLFTDTECFIVDDFGKVLIKTNFAEEIHKETQKVFIVNMNGHVPSDGEIVLKQETIRFIAELPKIFRENLYMEIAEIIRIPSPFADEVTLRTQDGWDIKMRTDTSLEEAVTMIRTFLVRVLPQEKQNSIRWVDIRVPKKIYYATKEDEKNELLESDKKEDQSEKKEQ